nr:unnamed protein product [Callosobruchus analis]
MDSLQTQGIAISHTCLANLASWGRAKKFPFWFSQGLKELIIEKKEVHKRYIQTGLYSDYNKFSILRAQSKLLKGQSYQNYIAVTESSIVTNVKGFWKFFKGKEERNHIPSVMHFGNGSCFVGNDIFNLFAEYFSKMYSDNECAVQEYS